MGSLFHVVNDLERIGDHSMNIVEIGSARKKEKLRFSGKAEREIEELSGIVTSMLDKSIHIVKRQITDVEIIGEVIELESQVDKPVRDAGGPSCGTREKQKVHAEKRHALSGYAQQPGAHRRPCG